MPKKTYHNKKRGEPIVFVVSTKIVELVAEMTTQLVKPTIVPLRYPYIIYSSFEHRAPNCAKKVEVYNMFGTRPTTTTTIIPINLKPNNVPVNVVIVTTHSQVPKQQVLREHEPMKAKTITDWQIEEQCVIPLFILSRSYEEVT